MQHEQSVVFGGVDAHADTHEAAALDERGVLLGTASFAAAPGGYASLLGWLREFGEVRLIAVESTGAYAAGLARYLHGQRVAMVEVNRPHSHTRRRRGKDDAIDAETAARQDLSGQATAVPKQTDGIVESIRQLRVARSSAVKARRVALVQLNALIITAPQDLREQLAVRTSTKAKANLSSPATGQRSPIAVACRQARAQISRTPHRAPRHRDQ